MEWDKIVKTISAGIASLATFVFGKPDLWLKLLLLMVVADYISGIAAVVIAHTLNSRVGALGILKKVMYFFVVVVAHVIDVVTNAGGVLRNLTIGFLIANEGISILENTSRCGIPWPKKLKDVLEQLKNKNNEAQ